MGVLSTGVLGPIEEVPGCKYPIIDIDSLIMRSIKRKNF